MTKPLGTRKGTDIDKAKLSKTFAAVGYDIVRRENLASNNIIEEIKDVVNQSSTNDSLIVCILSHGFEGKRLWCW